MIEYDQRIKENNLRLDKMEAGLEIRLDFDKFLKEKDNMDSSDVLCHLLEKIQDNTAKMITKDDLLDVRAEVGTLIQNVTSLNGYKAMYQAKHSDLEERVITLLANSETTILK